MPRKTKIGTDNPRRAWLGHHFQDQKVKGQGHRGGGILWRPPAYSLLNIMFIELVTQWVGKKLKT